MKQMFVVLLATLLLSALGMGQIPQLMSHQGYVADTSGTGITGTLPMTFRMFNDSTGGSAILTQSFPGVAITKGVFTVNIDVSSLPFTSQYWLETEVNSETLAPRTRLTSAPYSLAPWATSGTDVYYNNGDVGIGTSSPAAKLDVVGGDAVINGVRVGHGVGNQPENTVVGSAAVLLYNTTGNYNTAVGTDAMEGNQTGSFNTAVGYRAQWGGNAGGSNTAVGYEALRVNDGNVNSAFGHSAMLGNTTGSENVAVGTAALIGNTTGSYNVAVGNASLSGNMTGTYLTAIGTYASVAEGLTNATAIGANATVSASNSLVLGNNANVGIGTSSPAAKLDVVGGDAVINGVRVGHGVGNQPENTVVGSAAVLLYNTTGNYNTAVGTDAMEGNQTGSFNTAVGYRAQWGGNAGGSNTAVGYEALRVNDGNVNSAFGHSAMLGNTTGSENVAVGTAALIGNTTGSYNVAVGNASLSGNMTGTYLTAIGTYASVAEGLTNATAIGANATVSASNSLVLGNNANVGIGTSSPGASNLLELSSTSKGLVLPRMTKTQRNAIASPVAGMMIYQTDNTPGLRVYNGTNWMRYTETAD